MVFCDPVPPESILSMYYRDSYYPSGFFGRLMLAVRTWAAGWRAASQLAFISERRVGGPGRVLEVGCGSGALLRRFAREGWRAVGIEPSEAASRHAAGRLRLDVRRGTLEQFNDTGGYDVVVLSHVFEHFPDIEWALEKVRSLVAPGGFVFMELPSADGRTYQGRYGHLPDLYFFNPSNARLFFESRGFSVAGLTTLFLPRMDGPVLGRLPLGLRGPVEALWTGLRQSLGRDAAGTSLGGDWIRLLLRRVT